MSFQTETLGARLTRLLEASLRDPAFTQEILERLTEQQKAQPQPSGHEPEAQPLEQAQLL